MERIKMRNYLDAIVISGDPIEKIEADLAELEEESKKLTDWPKM